MELTEKKSNYRIYESNYRRHFFLCSSKNDLHKNWIFRHNKFIFFIGNCEKYFSFLEKEIVNKCCCGQHKKANMLCTMNSFQFVIVFPSRRTAIKVISCAASKHNCKILVLVRFIGSLASANGLVGSTVGKLCFWGCSALDQFQVWSTVVADTETKLIGSLVPEST